MQLTNQAMGAVMIAIQQSLMTQTDIVPVLQSFVFSETDEGLIVENPPILEINNTQEDENSDADV